MSYGRKGAFDVIKGIACFAVVLIHFNVKGEIGEVVKAAARFAVPTFFIVSGYFLSSVGRQVRKLFKLLIWATLFYAVFVVLLEALRRGGCESMTVTWFCGKYLSAAQLVRFFVSNSTLFAPHLWFVAALIYCYIFIDIFLNTKRRRRFACWTIIPLLALLAVSQEFSRAIGIHWHLIPIRGVVGKAYISVSALFVIRALPFFLIGVWLRSTEEKVREKGGNSLIWLFVTMLGCVCSIMEYYLLDQRVIGFYLGSTMTAVSLVIWAMKTDARGRFINLLEWMGRDLSLYIYIFHIAIGRLLVHIGEKLHYHKSLWFELSIPPLVLLLSVFIAYIIKILKGYINDPCRIHC